MDMPQTEEDWTTQRAFERDMFFVYVLKSERGLYIGYTTNLMRRYKEHITGKSPFTKRYKDWQILYFEAHTNELDAKRREHYLKTSTGNRSIHKMVREALHG